VTSPAPTTRDEPAAAAPEAGQAAPAGGSRWIVSAPFDLSLVAVPFAITALVFFTPTGADHVPLWAFLLLVVAFDVAHVWGTLYVSYLDREALRRRWPLFLLPIPLSLLVAYRIHAYSPVAFWTLLAYVAIHHFISQQWGFVALYKLRGGERDVLDRYLDKWTLWTGALAPILWWHASPSMAFDWFAAGEEFLFRIPPVFRRDIVVVAAVVGAVYAARQLQLAGRGRFNPGKNLWMLAAWTSWSLGVAMADHPLVALACVNLLHGIPFMGLLWFRCNRRWEGVEAPSSPALAWLSQRRNVLLWFGLLVALALGEELLWDRFVWGVYLPSHAGLERVTLSPEATSVWVAVLATPQIVHYYLDAWLWKLDGSNPDFHAALGLPAKR